MIRKKFTARNMTVYNAVSQTFKGNGLGVLHDASDVKVTYDIDGTRTLEFKLDFKSPSWSLIKPLRFILCENQYYRIKSYSRGNADNDSVTITCYHVLSDASKVYLPIFAKDGIDAPAYDILVEAFKGSRFHIMTPTEVAQLGMEWANDNVWIDETGSTYASNILSSVLSYLEKGELYVNNYNIAIVKRLGFNKGVRLSECINTQSIQETVDANEVINVLHVSGKEGLPLPEQYVDSIIRSEQSIALFGEHASELSYDDVEDPAELLSKALYEISPSNENRIDFPKTSLTVRYIDLAKLYADYPTLHVGDSVHIASLFLQGVYNECRVTKIEYYPFEPTNSSITIGDPPKTVTDLLAGSIATGNALAKVTDERGRVKASWLSNIKASMQTYVNSMLGQLQVELHKTGDVWVHPDDPNKALAIFGGQLAIANSKTPDGDWAWSTFGDGDGFTADKINTGQLNTSVVKIQDDEGYLNIFANLIEMYAFKDVTNQANDILGFQCGIDTLGKFVFSIFNTANGEPAIYMDSEGYVRINGILSSDTVITDAIYSELGDIAELTVDKVQTVSFVQKYLLKDTSPVNYVQIDDQWQMFITGVTDGTVIQHVNRYGQPLYWEKDVTNAELVNGMPVVDGKQVTMKTEKTDYPVKVYQYKQSIKRQLGFDEDGIPVDIYGVGTKSNDSVQGKVIVKKETEEFKITKYSDTAEKVESEIVMGKNSSRLVGFDLTPNRLEFGTNGCNWFKVTKEDGTVLGVRCVMGSNDKIKSLVLSTGKVIQWVQSDAPYDM